MNDKENSKYRRHIRLCLLRHVSPGPNRILDIGCGEGENGAYLKRHFMASEVVGIELDGEAALKAGDKLDHVICGDIEAISLKQPILEGDSFDYVICGDVLEHLKDPWKQLARFKRLIKPQGKIIASIPNIRHLKVVMPIMLKGEWKYTDQGILDRSHLRFFTKSSAVSLFIDAGYSVDSVTPNLIGKKYLLMYYLSASLLVDFLATQWIIVARPLESN